MKIVTGEEMRKIDRSAIEVIGIPGIILMENAGKAVADTIKKLLSDIKNPRVCIFAGKGNNGGDGFVIARHLVNAQVRVKTFLLCDAGEVQGDARVNLDILTGMGIEVEELRADGLPTAKIAVSMSDLTVDAVFGTGFRGDIDGYTSRIIDIINKSGRPVVAVDVPSGLDSSTGKVGLKCVRATHTITFGLPKAGLFLYPGADYVGELTIADIGLPRFLLTDNNLKLNLSTADIIRQRIPPRYEDSHKGTFGKVFVIAGSPNMAGAAVLASTAALKSGAGIVTLGVPIGLHGIMNSKLTEVMIRGLPETESGSISLQAQSLLDGISRDASALAVGPGLSTHSETAQLVRNIIMMTSVPTVVDADGINALAQDTAGLRGARAPIILTPHPGEMARLTGLSIQEIKEDRLDVARQTASQFGKIIVLKGARTIIADPSGVTYINPTGNSGMATAGSGDVLTGIIAGFLAQGMDPLAAAISGVYVHGLAGDTAASILGKMGVTASNILENVPGTLKSLVHERGENHVGRTPG
ncbi:MAG: NAD(P)H-hydrate dehydratase [Firmicutes bacterium]|nr:NAD(P)H-hydrate dehydratase [Bacillota bacterium]